MKKSFIISVLVIFVLSLFGQDNITINFNGSGAELDSVYVENTLQQTNVTLLGNQTLLLIVTQTSIEENNLQKEVIIYPNPSEGFCYIEFYQEENAKTNFDIYSLSGQKVYSKSKIVKGGYNSFLLKGLLSGSYVINIESNKNKLSQNFIVTSSKASHIELINVSNDSDLFENNQIHTKIKSNKNIVEMPYNIGEELMLIGYSYGFVVDTVFTIPIGNQTINFEFNETCNPETPISGSHTVSDEQITWIWNSVSDADGYKYNTANNYSTATDNGTSTSYTQNGLDCNTNYNLYVWAYNNCGESGVLELVETTIGTIPNAPIVGTHIPEQHQIIWNWNVVPNADGYKYNTTDNYSTATDNGTSTTYTQSGLDCDTEYNLYVWAYNNCGESGVLELVETTTGTSPNAPTAGTHTLGYEQIIWNWNLVSDAVGYKYNTINNYLTATDNGTSTTYAQSGLDGGTEYNLYVWAYNNCGESVVLNLSAITNNWATDTETNLIEVVNPTTGKIWMDRNLGATQAATSSNDANAYGDLYQWGRAADGHQIRTSGITFTLSNTDNPEHGNFIANTSMTAPIDWRSSQNNNLWQGLNGTNNPCPPGWRIPTEAEWDAEFTSWGTNNSAGAFGSPLKLPAAGYRQGHDGLVTGVSSNGHYWSSTVDGYLSRGLSFYSSTASWYGRSRVLGFSVRCIKN